MRISVDIEEEEEMKRRTCIMKYMDPDDGQVVV